MSQWNKTARLSVGRGEIGKEEHDGLKANPSGSEERRQCLCLWWPLTHVDKRGVGGEGLEGGVQ